MGEQTAISWTDHTFNTHWGCTKIAAPGGERSACDHCYAEAFSHRLGLDLWGKDADRRFFGDKHWAEPRKWNRAAAVAGERRRVFCASMADVFEDRRDLDGVRARLWALIEETPALDWLLLTKRPEQMRRLTPVSWCSGWPSNVWAGTTVEDQRAADLRVPRLLAVPAAVRFLSCEPLFGPIDFDAVYPGTVHSTDWLASLDWVIVGGESGAHHQPLDLNHARSVRDQCRAAGVPFFFKQVGGRTPTTGGNLLDGREWHDFPGGLPGAEHD